jgi:asparagine synthase (glutamine-hydrolysing)
LPGLTGIVSAQSSIRAKVPSVAKRLGTYKRSWLYSYAFADRATMACGKRREDSAALTVMCKDSVLLGLDGEVFSIGDASGKTLEVIPHGCNEPASTLLRLYAHCGIDFVSRLRGNFSIAVWDERAENLHLVTDRFGMRPLYYHAESGAIMFSSTARSLVLADAVSSAPDQECISEYLLLGLPLGTGTFFKDLQLVPPGSVLTLALNMGIKNRRYWQMRFDGSVAVRYSVDDAAALLESSLREVITESAAPDDVLDVPLSGGLDSRTLVVAAREAGRSVRTYTIGGEGSADLRIGPQVARAMCIPNICWQVRPEDFLEWIEEAVYLTDGMGNPFTSAILFLARHLPDDARIVLEGANTFDNYYRFLDTMMPTCFSGARDPRNALQRVFEGPLVDEAGRMSTSLLSSEYQAYALQCTRSATAKVCDDIPSYLLHDPLNMLDYLEHHIRLRRFVSCGSMLVRAYCEVRHPFLDPRVVDTILSIAPLLKSKEKRLHGSLIRQVLPEIASIAYERTGLAANASASRHLVRYILEGVRRVLAPAVPMLRRPPRLAINYGLWFQQHKGLQARLKDILFDPSTIRRGYFDSNAMQAAVLSLFKGDTRNLLIIGRALSLEHWHRFFQEKVEPGGRIP